ncbi:hypothetical protein T492DRAFT_568173, partial [Pavlovales sp. CCMP2436]
ADTSAIYGALGFLPSNAHSVASHDAATGLPTVLQLYPLSAERSVNKGSTGRDRLARMQPWPTLFWLICPSLKAQVSKLECLGLIPMLQSDVASHPGLALAMKASQNHYAELRWSSLLEPDAALVRELGWGPRLQETGVGGVRDHTQLKCLHMHLAHSLAAPRATANPVGLWVQ